MMSSCWVLNRATLPAKVAPIVYFGLLWLSASMAYAVFKDTHFTRADRLSYFIGMSLLSFHGTQLLALQWDATKKWALKSPILHKTILIILLLLAITSTILTFLVA
jgi:hypothetical protein